MCSGVLQEGVTPPRLYPRSRQCVPRSSEYKFRQQAGGRWPRQWTESENEEMAHVHHGGQY